MCACASLFGAPSGCQIVTFLPSSSPLSISRYCHYSLPCFFAAAIFVGKVVVGISVIVVFFLVGWETRAVGLCVSLVSAIVPICGVLFLPSLLFSVSSIWGVTAERARGALRVRCWAWHGRKQRVFQQSSGAGCWLVGIVFFPLPTVRRRYFGFLFAVVVVREVNLEQCFAECSIHCAVLGFS